MRRETRWAILKRTAILNDILLKDLKNTWMADADHHCVFISAKHKTNIAELRKVMYEEVKKIHIKRYPYNSFLYEKYEDQEEID